MIVENRTGYDTDDLLRFAAKGAAATRTRGPGGAPLRIVYTASPIRSRGCAEVGRRDCTRGSCRTTNGRKMSIALAAPWRFDLRRLTKLHEHEFGHIRGYEHEDMDKNLLLSLGPTSEWARGSKIRYYGRAPAQLPFLRYAGASRPGPPGASRPGPPGARRPGPARPGLASAGRRSIPRRAAA